jgi:hypothetical protein
MKYLLLWSGEKYGMKKARIPAIESRGFSGHWRGEKLFNPDNGAIAKALPRRYRAAFNRAPIFWYDKARDDSPCHCTLYTTRGAPIVTIYLQPLTES